jgi:hypothetical protein
VFTNLFFLLVSFAPCRAQNEYNIVDYGAAGDSLTLNTKAINAAIAECATKGGGTVIIPEGTFLTGTISLKSHVSLYLMPGAEIKGTSDLNQYIPYVPAGETRGPEHFRWNRALVLGDHVENVTIEGSGVINGDHVFDPEGEEGMRGPHTILFGGSRNIHIKGITINNAANYAFLAYQLEDATFTGVKFNAGWDGIHIRWGKNLKISDCTFYTGDDAIAGGYWENMEISDNEINSSCNGIRLIMPATNLSIERCHFFGDGKFEHRTSREKKRKNMLSAIILQPGGWGKAEGMLENVLIRDVTIENVDNPLNMILNEGNNAKGILVENLRATHINKSACSVESWKGGRYEDVSFKNVVIEYVGHDDPELLEIVPGQPHVDARPLPCWALFARCIDKLVLDSVQFRYTGKELRPAFIFDDIGTLDLNEISYDEADLSCLSDKSRSEPEEVISEVIHNNTPHFKVETSNATYFIEKQSGGCSSLLDREGRDWVGFKLTGTDGPTLSSDSDYRGIPNLVFQEPGNGTGHPGFNTCETVQVSGNELEVQSNDQLWQFRWIFHDHFAEILIEKTDESRAYWFLYEGPVAGHFAPNQQYWGNNVDGLRRDTPSIFKDPAGGNWQWAFFGDTTVPSTLFLVQHESDELDDFFCYMGNNAQDGNGSADGMNVFGFGRSLRTEPLLTGPNRFYIGFFPLQVSDSQALEQLSLHIRHITH